LYHLLDLSFKLLFPAESRVLSLDIRQP